MQANPNAESPASTPLPHRRMRWLRALMFIGSAALLVWPAWTLGHMYLAGNFYEIIPGKLYRGAQPSPRSLENIIDRYQIRTVLNTRGCCWPEPWYHAQAELCARRGVNLEDITFSAVHLPSRDEMSVLLDVLDHAEYPIFIHCRHGADRTGIAAMTAILLIDGQTFQTAQRQLSMHYGHAPLGKPTVLDRFMNLYGDWLTQTKKAHAPELFRRWIRQEYQGGWCDARFEKVERLFKTPRVGQALEYNVVVRNTSGTPWHFRALKTSGHHVTFKLVDKGFETVYEGRAGMLDTDVAPGASIQVLLRVPPIPKAGYYRLQMDMIEEGHCWFHQSGSEMWEEEFEIRE